MAEDGDSSTTSADTSTDTSDAGSSRVDPLDDFLARYSFAFAPEYVLKLRRSVGPASLRANYYFHGSRAPYSRWAFVAKPVDEARHPWIHKLAVEPAYSMARLSSSKIKLWDLLRFQALVQYDWELHRPSLQWRVTSKWSRSPGKLGRKEKVHVGEIMELRPQWRVDLFMPEVEGQVGGGETDVYVEKGHCHITVPKVEVILPLNNIKASLRSGVQRLRQGRHAGQEPSTPEWSAEGAIGSVESRNAAVAAPDTTNSPAPPAIASVSQVVVPNWWARQRQGFQEEQLRQPKISYTVPAGEKDQQQSWHDAMQRLRQGLQKLSGSVGK